MKAWIPALAVAFVLVAIVAVGEGRSESTQKYASYTVLCFEKTIFEAIMKKGQRPEKRNSRGLAQSRMYELWTAPSGGFTLTVRNPDMPHMICILASGHHWHEVEGESE